MSNIQKNAAFDSYAREYDEVLNRGLAVSGEEKTFFARGRIAWLGRCLKSLGFLPEMVLDYGCGTGGSTPYFLELLQAQSVIGIDLSAESLQVASRTHRSLPVQYFLPKGYEPSDSVDLVYCNGVFHHIPSVERPAVAKYIADCLRPAGMFALWENNPWNPGTRYVMSRVPFDRDANTMTARAARSLARSVGLEVLSTNYCFVFPRFLKIFRRIEPYLARLPFGAQYQVLCRKPQNA